MAGVTAFREAWMNAGALRTDDFDSFDARKMRYVVYWALLENSVYRKINLWSTSLKTTYGLYEFVRGIYNPTARIADAWQTFLMGGSLDPQAGDGASVPSALPILVPGTNTKADALRIAIAMTWLNSSWQIKKDVLTLRGSVLGDIGLRVIDDTARGKVYLDIVDPSTLYDVSLDAFGNVKGYIIEETRPDPRQDTLRYSLDALQRRYVTYREECARDGDLVVFRTYLDGNPYAWNADQGVEWSEPYGFVPMVLIQHNNVGGAWGWSELHSSFTKVFECDDLASKVDDQIRIIVHSKWLFAGVNKKDAVSTRGKTSSTSSDEDEQRAAKREQEDALYSSDSNAKAQALVAPLQIADATAQIKELLAELERDYPELQHDIWSAGGDTSGKALSIARQRVETRVIKRRPNYDNALVRAQQMAVAIGGYRRYDGYQGFDLDSYGAGLLDHSIGSRPVFAPDRMGELEAEKAFWDAATAARNNGVGIDAFLRRQKWSEDDINAVMNSPEYQARLALMKTGLTPNG
jgi:hypothetical protein